MFFYLDGVIAGLEQGLAVVDCGGVGYAAHTTSTTQRDLTPGKQGRLYTYCHIREDCFDIYGFSTLSEKRCFQLLIGVSGVGPKAALSILSASTPDALAMSILAEDEKAIAVAQGIGKKTAQRVILELKDKMAGDTAGFHGPAAAGGRTNVPGGAKPDAEARAALAVLGYGPGEISMALRDVEADGLSAQEIIRLALKKMVK